jgi:hypothetical protein
MKIPDPHLLLDATQQRATLVAMMTRRQSLSLPIRCLPKWTWLLAFAGLLLSGCSQELRATRGLFWVEAARSTVRFEPALPLPEEGTVTVWTSRVVIVDNSAPRRLGMPHDYSMELLPIDGAAFGKPMALHYRIGGRRRIPLERGQLGRLTVWQKRLEGSEQPAQAIVLETWQKLQAVDQKPVLAVIDVLGLVPRTLLPPALQRIEPGLEVVYQASERPSGECYRAVIHRQFAIGAPSPDAEIPGQQARLASPGERLVVADLQAHWDVVLLDHRQTSQSTCAGDVAEWWSWAAIRRKTGSGDLTPTMR